MSSPSGVVNYAPALRRCPFWPGFFLIITTLPFVPVSFASGMPGM
jgi:hypothetical protein